MKPVSRRDAIKNTLKVSAGAMVWSRFEALAAANKISEFGWSCEGQGLDAPKAPSIYGVGEGAKYFGLRKAVYMYHPNNRAGMEKLHNLEEIVCDITKWVSTACGYGCVQLRYDEGSMWTGQRRTLEEAKALGALSLTYPNVKGAYIDDTLGDAKPKLGAITSEEYTSIRTELRKSNPQLKLWSLVYSKQLYQQDWATFKSNMDVIYLWVRDSADLSNLDRHVDRCRDVFPDKRLILGCYLWDFPNENPMPLELLKFQWERVQRYLSAGKVDGYAIMGAYLIDSAPQQARWVRDFIAAN